jgi:hypothetical protein
MKRSSFLTIAAAVAAVAGTGPAKLLASDRIAGISHTPRKDRSWMIGRPGGCAGSGVRNALLREVFAGA